MVEIVAGSAWHAISIGVGTKVVGVSAFDVVLNTHDHCYDWTMVSIVCVADGRNYYDYSHVSATC